MLYFYPVYFETCSGSNEKNHNSLNSEKKKCSKTEESGKKIDSVHKKAKGY